MAPPAPEINVADVAGALLRSYLRRVWLNTTTGQQNIRDLKLTALRRRVGVVFEDAFLFAGTVAENIAYGHPQATQDDIRRAADAAGASGFINALPQGSTPD